MKTISTAFLFSTLLLLCSCTNFYKKNYPPTSGRLQERIDMLYSAEKDGNAEVLSSTLSHSAENEYPKRLKKLAPEKEGRVMLWKPLEIDIREEDHDKDGRTDLFAVVTMDVRVFSDLLNKPVRIENQTDYWVYNGKDWFWFWRGWPYE